MSRTRLTSRVVLVLAASLGLAPCGCRNDREQPPGAPAVSTKNATVDAARPSTAAPTTEAAPALTKDLDQPQGGPFDEGSAREKLRTALDSWVFGDEPRRFEEEHPEISFQNTDYLFDRPKLQKYEVGPGRKEKDLPEGVVGYQFPVILTLESQVGTEIRKKHNFSVRTRDNIKWSVFRSR